MHGTLPEVRVAENDAELATLAGEIKQAIQDHKHHARASEFSAMAGMKLIAAQELVPHGQWGSWLKANVGIKKSSAYNYILIAKNQDRFPENSSAGNSQRGMLRVIKGRSRSVEWYTPPEIVKAERRVMGGIDLDPASCATANEVVRATKFYTKEDNGLILPWHGNVHLNSPYHGQAKEFVAKLVEEFEAGHVSQAMTILYTSNAGLDWVKPLWEHGLLCFTSRRLKFWNPEGCKDPPSESLIAYLGPRRAAFKKEFSKFGIIAVEHKEHGR